MQSSAHPEKLKGLLIKYLQAIASFCILFQRSRPDSNASDLLKFLELNVLLAILSADVRLLFWGKLGCPNLAVLQNYTSPQRTRQI
jgi:hypothetical protein